ncbi:trace amine-associated receptor 7h-like [Lytechinus variegatus]|uniref:trace amine-associated receptor 7h-like n=1 Tax=Lytechinus variegatus TaxID=7654 RepID=UPI001BB220A6|nr:trace amine-associated receptor 7h-like [Lytechinus variegatus]
MTLTISVLEEEVFTEIPNITDGSIEAERPHVPVWIWHEFKFRDWYRYFQLLFGCVGVSGNLLVIVVLYSRRKAKSSTDTLIAALAAADLLTSLIILPRPYLLTTPYLWVTKFYCYLFGTDALLRTCITASVFTLTALSVQRYTAVIYPIRYRFAFTKSRTVMYVIALWILSAAITTYLAFFAYVDPVRYLCSYKPLPPGVQIPSAVAYLTASFLAPVMIMVVTQLAVVRRLHREADNFNKESSRSDESDPAYRLRIARNRVINLVLIVIITFLLSWTPAQLGLLITQIIIVRGNQLLDQHIYWSFVVVAYVNSCANPIIYTARYPQFRKAVKDMFKSKRIEQRPLFDQDEGDGTTKSTVLSSTVSEDKNTV